MKVKHEARTLDGDIVEPEHTIEQVCSSCGYDLDESEIAAAGHDRCLYSYSSSTPA